MPSQTETATCLEQHKRNLKSVFHFKPLTSVSPTLFSIGRYIFPLLSSLTLGKLLDLLFGMSATRRSMGLRRSSINRGPYVPSLIIP